MDRRRRRHHDNKFEHVLYNDDAWHRVVATWVQPTGEMELEIDSVFVGTALGPTVDRQSSTITLCDLQSGGGGWVGKLSSQTYFLDGLPRDKPPSPPPPQPSPPPPQPSPPVPPYFTLEKGGNWVGCDLSFQIDLQSAQDTNALIQLRKAPSFDDGCHVSAGCWPDNEYSALLSGDVVAIYLVGCDRIVDCSTSPCNPGTYPISFAPSGAPFKVCVNDACDAEGGAVGLGDYIWFKRQTGEAGVWGDFYLDTDGAGRAQFEDGSSLVGAVGAPKSCAERHTTRDACFRLCDGNFNCDQPPPPFPPPVPSPPPGSWSLFMNIYDHR